MLTQSHALFLSTPPAAVTSKLPVTVTMLRFRFPSTAELRHGELNGLMYPAHTGANMDEYSSFHVTMSADAVSGLTARVAGVDLTKKR